MGERQTHVLTVWTDGAIDRAEFGALSAMSKRRSAARKLARAMLDADVPNGPVEGRSRDGSLLWSHRSLAKFARFDTSEDPRPHLSKWVPNPRWALLAVLLSCSPNPPVPAGCHTPFPLTDACPGGTQGQR
jgi:hypothetical protein